MSVQSRLSIRVEENSIPRSALESAEHWLLRSGIYILNPDDPNYGAVFATYDPEYDVYKQVYPEATGYVASLLRFLAIGSTYGSDTVRASGDWLLKWARQHCGIIAVGIEDGRTPEEAYAFDNGICCRGLLDLYELTGNNQYLLCAERIADWLIQEAVSPDGSVKPILHIGAGRFLENPSLWYGISGGFHAKIGMALLRLHSVTGRREARDTALRIFEWALRQQRPDGSFPANRHVRFVYMHAHCYTAEALLYAYAWERNPRFLEAAERAIAWIGRLQNPIGYFPRWQGNGWFRGTASDAQAQAVRLLCLLNMLESRRTIVRTIQKATVALLSMQSTGPGPREHGGFFEGDVRRYRFYLPQSSLMKSWTAMFAIHALSLQRETGVADFFVEGKHLF